MIVLDTHVWLWWVDNPDRLNTRIIDTIREAEGSGLKVSVASIWEIAIKAERGRLALPLETRAWVERASSYPGIDVESLNPEDALSSAQLPGQFHGDPFDRVIVAFARRLGVPVATVDRRIIDYAHVRTIS